MAYGGNLQSIPNTLVGGNVVTILARTAIRLNALKQAASYRSQSNGLQVPTYNPPSVWVAAVPVSVLKQEAYSYQSDATSHALESGAVLTDHVIVHPVRIDLSFEVTNWEEGAAEYALQLLEKMRDDRELLTLQTKHRQLDGMVLTSLQASNEAETWGALAFRASFQRIKLITLQTKKYPASTTKATEKTGGPDVTQSSQPATDAGQQAPKQSALLTLTEKLF